MELLYTRLDGKSGHDMGLSLLETLYGAPLPKIERTKLGKPYFVDCPLHFSIAHTKNHAFCVLSEHPIGIDTEELDREINLNLADKILSPMEMEQFRQANDPRLALLKFWVLKEAAGKCAGEGLQLWPNHTEFSLDDPRLQEIDGCIVAVIEEDL